MLVREGFLEEGSRHQCAPRFMGTQEVIAGKTGGKEKIIKYKLK